MTSIVAVLVLLAMLACVVLIPLGLPGLWLIVVITLGVVLTGMLPWTFGLSVAAAAAVAEAGELLVLKRFGKAYGGSSRAFWGCLPGFRYRSWDRSSPPSSERSPARGSLLGWKPGQSSARHVWAGACFLRGRPRWRSR